ncbi:hypothetical protein JD969_15930 [Planctomycetota bacterium]|nr:hypothetical protein JD969_15930 [Planctomycetota bacterium]
MFLVKQGIVLLPGIEKACSGKRVRAVELELADIGYLPTRKLRERLKRCSRQELDEFGKWSRKALLESVGGGHEHVPLFRKFPKLIPVDTSELWWKNVLVHFLQAEGQACITCGEVGTTHVLKPCEHVVCDHCFDGENYSACPVCGREADLSSPFFKEGEKRGRPVERVTFKLLDLGESEVAESKRLFFSLCERTQALSPNDRESLICIIKHWGLDVLSWLPSEIPLRENVAVVFGVLLEKHCDKHVIEHARKYLKTATDVLRLIAVYSGADGSLQSETKIEEVQFEVPSLRFVEYVEKVCVLESHQRATMAYLPIQVNRFKVAKMPRWLRRELMGKLEGIGRHQLIEDMLRHQSYWVWVGEFLHPSEYADRYPKVADAFKVVRKKSEDGERAPKFRNWYGRVEHLLASGDIAGLVDVLSERPGEFGRRLDHVLQLVVGDEGKAGLVVDRFVGLIPELATPMLLTLYKHLPSRLEKVPVRVYWPKGRVAMGAMGEDKRVMLSRAVVEPITVAIRDELLKRFGEKKGFERCVIDEQLGSVMVPFNERTASRSAVSLPRGSKISFDMSKVVRLFLHWCEPKADHNGTDLDLSVAFYDEQWQYKGVCSYYELTLKDSGRRVVAQSSGDRLNAPWPKGATEFVDVNVEKARGMGARYAVTVINAYSGLPFSQLERGFAGVMLRDDADGEYLDPRTVELKFDLDGENGIFMPMVIDLEEGVLHWLDVQSKGELCMNNVEKSNVHISRICPNVMAYFDAGLRPSMFDLALLHAAARCERVVIRGDNVCEYVKDDGEVASDFYKRIKDDAKGGAGVRIESSGQVLGFFYKGNVEVAGDSEVYALFREGLTTVASAPDFLS